MSVVFKITFLVFYLVGLLQFGAAIINGTISVEEIEVNGKWLLPDYATNFPFMVEIVKGGVHYCGGAIIRKNTVITTANCISLDGTIPDLSQFVLLAGNQVIKEDWQIFVQKRSIAKAVLHSGWPENAGSNIAILKTSSDFKLTPWVNLVNLDYHWMEPYNTARLFGWGYTEGNRFSSLLRHTWTNIFDSASCTHLSIPGLLCLNEESSRPCYGDFGGPVILDGDNPLNHTLIAMIAFNPGAPTPGNAGEITCAEERDSIGINVTYYRNYIETVISNDFEQPTHNAC